MTIQLLLSSKNYSSWSVRPWLVVTHFNIPHEEILANLYIEEDAKERVLAWNPAGTVPVLRDGELVIGESIAIMEYLAEQNPDNPLWPTAPIARARARAVSAEMHASFAHVRGEMPMNARGFAPGLNFTDGAYEDIARISEIWRDCRTRYGDQGDLLFGDFTIADAMYAPVVSRFKTYGIVLDDVCQAYADALLGLPACRAWFELAQAEPGIIDHYELG